MKRFYPLLAIVIILLWGVFAVLTPARSQSARTGRRVSLCVFNGMAHPCGAHNDGIPGSEQQLQLEDIEFELGDDHIVRWYPK